MKIDRVKTNFGRTVSTGVKFEFLRIDVSMEASVEGTESPLKIARLLKKECKAACEGMIYKELEATHG